MRFLALVEQGARTFPALLPLALVSIALTLWACERKRWLWAVASGALGCAACLLYVGSPAGAVRRLDGAAPPVLVGKVGGEAPGPRSGTAARARRPRGSHHALLQQGRFSSSVRMHPRFPGDFPVPREFRLESNSGGSRSGNLTVRFRFTGEATNAVCDLRQQGKQSGWSVEILAPHRMIFRKDSRMVEAWFSYPAHSVVLDIPDNP